MMRHWRRSIQQQRFTEHAASHTVIYKLAMHFVLACGIIFFLGSCASSSQSYNPNKKYGPNELKQDFDVAWKTWQQNHPSLYWYNPKDTVDKGFNELENSLTDSLTEMEFRNRLAMAAEKIKCGHTSVRLSKGFGKYSARQRYELQFPIAMKTWGGDSLVVSGNAFRRDSDLVRGTIIRSVNGRPAAELISQMGRLISADGFGNNFKYQVLSNSFPTYYRYTFGLSDYYTFEYVAPDGSTKFKRLFNYNPRADTLDRRRIATPQARPQKPSKKELRNFELLSNRSLRIDTANHLAYMLLNTFSKNKLNRFFRESFRTLKEQNIPNLVIELRENGGGNISKSTRLTRYISDHAFKVADSAVAVNFKYAYPGSVKHGFWYKLEHWLVSPFRKNGLYHFKQLERRHYKPFKKNHYDGQVYIITGGYTFSAATLFIHPLKGQKNVTVIGEETGGGAYGNTAVNIPDVVLPNTGIRVRLPLYRLVVDKNLPHDGRGILPDIYVPPGSSYLRKNEDPKMEKIRQLIREKKVLM
ncbi:MAG: S41 family peptidase [Bacteroidota bacterium]